MFQSRFIATCDISADLRKQLRLFKFSKSTSLNVLICEVSTMFPLECSIEEIRKELSQQPRFVLISYVLRHADGRLSYPMCLVFYSPEGCSPELQMMYAGSKENVVRECEVTNPIFRQNRLLQSLFEKP
ncbi:unnamed protein product [Angiostrongylus costaricensis]|uniref:ADF-H domain-containing protein n=1 Tax=Angiostrongylus costaricensis TaxID=334426 RepID=A0A3P7I9F0_ANGCS|nr:unnamed protein product [Angiostrongylus costaricensis]